VVGKKHLTENCPRLRTSPNYQILALCNSSLDSTEAAIKAHELPASTRAYSSPEELVADTDIDLVVISTRVDTHYGLAKTAVKAGKNTYVEWPLGSNAEQARELVALAREKGVRTVVGLQGRREPSILKAKEIIERIGYYLFRPRGTQEGVHDSAGQFETEDA
jgi:predicted dehydrogenase